MNGFAEEIVVISRTAGDVDDYGNPTFTESSVTVMGAFAPTAGTEALDGQDQLITQPQAYLPFDTVIDSNAVLTIRGLDFEVDGVPEIWRSPFTGWKAGIQVPLRRTAG